MPTRVERFRIPASGNIASGGSGGRSISLASEETLVRISFHVDPEEFLGPVYCTALIRIEGGASVEDVPIFRGWVRAWGSSGSMIDDVSWQGELEWPRRVGVNYVLILDARNNTGSDQAVEARVWVRKG